MPEGTTQTSSSRSGHSQLTKLLRRRVHNLKNGTKRDIKKFQRTGSTRHNNGVGSYSRPKREAL
jgi:hypothetical protein